MEVSNITLDRESNEIRFYFKETDYCVRTDLTHTTYRMYCEFNSIDRLEVIEIVPVTRIKWSSDLENLVAL
jgi:hypothetical protein